MSRSAKIPPRRFTVDEFQKMGEVGILNEDDRTELIDGEILQLPPITPRHAGLVTRLNHAITPLFMEDAITSIQNPVDLDEYHEPLPDLALLQRKPDFYASHHPWPNEIHMLVEVADLTLAYDRRVKAPLYARYSIREYWLVNVLKNAITVYRDPSPDGYRTSQILRRGDRFAPAAFPDRELAVSDILGEA